MGQTIVMGNNTVNGSLFSFNYGQSFALMGSNSPRRNACVNANGGFVFGFNNDSTVFLCYYNVPTYVPQTLTANTYPLLASGNFVAPASQTIYLPFGLTKYLGDGGTDVNSYFTCRISFTMMWKPNSTTNQREGFCSYGGDIQFFPYRWANGYGGSTTSTSACSQHLLMNNYATSNNNNYSTAYGATTSNANMNLGRAYWLYNASSNGLGGDQMLFNLGVIGEVDVNGLPTLFFKCMSPYWLGGTASGNVEINYSLDLIDAGNMPTVGGSFIETFGMKNNWKFYY
jgi:hypothetical protein